MSEAPKPLRIYYEPWCGFCRAALHLAQVRGIACEGIDLTGDREQRRALTVSTGQRTIPYVFLNDRFIGGYSELRALDASGELAHALQE